MTINAGSSDTIYDYNPFNTIIQKKALKKETIIFPDKLQNTHGFPFSYAKRNVSHNTTHIKQPCRKSKTFNENHFVIDHAARILNLNPLVKKEMNRGYWYEGDFLTKWNLDMLAFRLYHKNYLTWFNLIPAIDEEALIVVAVVPILPASRVDVFFKFLHNVVIIYSTACIFICIVHYSETIPESSDV